MTRKTEKSGMRAAFTLVELLTVMAIIALLIGLLVPALGHVKTTAKIVQQRAQLKSIETALEAFAGMYGDYPPSNFSGVAATGFTSGAQKLAEALIGVDLRGFDPRSDFDRRAIETEMEPYAVLNINTAVQADVDASLARRKGPYITVDENVNSFEIADIFAVGGTYIGEVYGGGAPGRDVAGGLAKRFGNVITDVFEVRNITYNSFDFSTNTVVQLTAKVGTPILYYRADTTKKQLGRRTGTGNPTHDDILASVYNWYDNVHLVNLGRVADTTLPRREHQWLIDDTGTHPIRGARAFYDYIRNPRIGTERWPYNPDSYILISAGPDGIFGNTDDITNFGSPGAR